MVRFVALAALVLLTFTGHSARAQESPVAELLQKVPDDLGLCLALRDVRGQLDRWRQTKWWAVLKQNPLVENLLKSNELRDLTRFEDELKRHLNIDFTQLKDDILGDAIVFAYQPALKGQEGPERGLLLLKARKSEVLSTLIEKVNEVQTASGELTSLEDRKYKDFIYYRRQHQRATHFYYQKGPFLAIASQEDVLHAMLDRTESTASPRREQLAKANLGKAVATLWLNPRIVEGELAGQAANKFGPEAAIFQSVLSFWKGLDGIAVSLQGDDSLEVRLSMIAKPGSEAHKLWETPSAPPTELWRKLPDNALLAAVGPIDVAKTFKSFRNFLPEKDAQNVDFFLQKNLGAATGLDVYGEILPNIGPDVGLALLPGEANGLPRGLIALGAKSAPKDAPVDQTLLKAAHLFTGLMLFEHNRKSPDLIRIRTVQQDGVEVRYITQEKLFPPGVQPALALKAGYLVLASSPETIASFAAKTADAPASDETPYVKIAPREWAKLMKAQRQFLVDHLVQKNRETPEAAGAAVNAIAEGFDVFQSLNLSHRQGGGQSAWILRLTPKN